LRGHKLDLSFCLSGTIRYEEHICVMGRQCMTISGVSSQASMTYAMAQNSASATDTTSNASGEVKTAATVEVVKAAMDEEKTLAKGILDMLV